MSKSQFGVREQEAFKAAVSTLLTGVSRSHVIIIECQDIHRRDGANYHNPAVGISYNVTGDTAVTSVAQMKQEHTASMALSNDDSRSFIATLKVLAEPYNATAIQSVSHVQSGKVEPAQAVGDDTNEEGHDEGLGVLIGVLLTIAGLVMVGCCCCAVTIRMEGDLARATFVDLEENCTSVDLEQTSMAGARRNYPLNASQGSESNDLTDSGEWDRSSLFKRMNQVSRSLAGQVPEASDECQ